MILRDTNSKRNREPLLCLRVQVVEDGYEFFGKRQLVTLFSAPNYCGEFDNAGAMMTIDESLMCSFQVCALAHIMKLFETVGYAKGKLFKLQILKPADKKRFCDYPSGRK